MKPSILVTGINGLAGWHLAQALDRQDYVVTGLVSHKATPFPTPSYPYNNLDFSDKKKVNHFFHTNQFETIIHTDHVCRLQYCEENSKEAWRINCENVKILLQSPHVFKTRFIFLSTDHVFSGDEDWYESHDIRKPITVFGQTKKNAEDFIMEHHKNFLIVRPTLLLGDSPNRDTGPVDWLRGRVEKNQPATYFEDEWRTPLFIEDFIKGMLAVINNNISGVLHLSSEQKITRWELAQKMVGIFGWETVQLQKRKCSDDAIPRVRQLSLKAGPFPENFSWAPTSLSDSLQSLKR
jgi:dTDP-4-dehydrorhamnose reductase